jgi:hypothetical protein
MPSEAPAISADRSEKPSFSNGSEDRSEKPSSNNGSGDGSARPSSNNGSRDGSERPSSSKGKGDNDDSIMGDDDDDDNGKGNGKNGTSTFDDDALHGEKGMILFLVEREVLMTRVKVREATEHPLMTTTVSRVTTTIAKMEREVRRRRVVARMVRADFEDDALFGDGDDDDGPSKGVAKDKSDGKNSTEKHDDDALWGIVDDGKGGPSAGPKGKGVDGDGSSVYNDDALNGDGDYGKRGPCCRSKGQRHEREVSALKIMLSKGMTMVKLERGALRAKEV